MARTAYECRASRGALGLLGVQTSDPSEPIDPADLLARVLAERAVVGAEGPFGGPERFLIDRLNRGRLLTAFG